MNEDLSRLSPGELFWDWVESRNYWVLLLAIPAMLGVVGAGAFVFYQLTWSPSRAEINCLEVSRAAYAAGDFQRSKLAQQAVIELAGRPEPEHFYKLAQSYSKLGQRNETVAMLSALAPLDKAGHPPAHLFLAEALTLPDDVPPQAIRLAETHLLRLLALQPQNTDARQLLGQLYVRLGQWEDARKQLTSVVSERPEVALHLALTQRGLGDSAASRAWAERAAKYFASKVTKAGTNDVATRANWADALVLQDDFRGAADVLETGWKRYQDQECRAELARVCFAWAADLAQDPASQPRDRLAIIQRGLDAAADNPDLLRELALLGSAPGEAGESARAKARALLADGRYAGLVYLTLGNVALQRGDLAQARTNFEAAVRSQPAPPEAANNLAALLTSGPKPELDRALKLVEPLLERQPVNPFFRDTRGQILLLQGRMDEALVDLEFALSRLPDPRPTHRALAKIYGQLGLKDLAAEHQRRAASPHAPTARP